MSLVRSGDPRFDITVVELSKRDITTPEITISNTDPVKRREKQPEEKKTITRARRIWFGCVDV